ncbi:MAG TPA: septal ring lytic transglycosylase RlpA family protein [Trichocoleus sp.]
MQANRIGTQLEEFYRNQGNAEQISVRWDPSQEQYLVTLNGTPLIAVDSDTILPDTTADPAQDALQVANRLRRLIGDAPPLEDIEGRPQLPEASTLAVTSVLSGMASWYGPGFHGRRSASGEVFDQNAMTAAHRTLPFGTEVRVTNLSNNRQVVVRINDRGPFGHGRVLDLSAAAAQSIGLAQRGVGMVRIEVLGRP